ncbi:MAG: four-helix bundle copper-binding protein, partial [Thermoplasmatota archaeon]
PKPERVEKPRVGPEGQPYRPDVAVVEACASTCSATFAYCLTQGGDYVDEHNLKSLFDCMEVCLLTASLVSRGSQYGEQLMAVCAEACRDVAAGAQQFGDDAHMRTCAGAARQAEAWCRA